jgi:hypothetical protein
METCWTICNTCEPYEEEPVSAIRIKDIVRNWTYKAESSFVRKQYPALRQHTNNHSNVLPLGQQHAIVRSYRSCWTHL